MRSLVGIGLVAIVLLRVSAAHAEDAPSAPAPAPPVHAEDAPSAPGSASPGSYAAAPAAQVASPPRRPEAAAAPPLPAASTAPLGDFPVLVAGPRRDAPATAEESYGPQTLIVDGLTLGTAVLAAGARSPAAGVGAGVLYGIGAPMVHLAHGRPWMALASFGTRVTAPALGCVTGALVGYAASSNDSHGGAMAFIGGGLVGLVAGLTAAVVLDAGVYSHAWKKAPPAWDGKPTLAPRASVTPEAASVGVGGAF